MDSITHIVLGATIGEALLGRRLGKKAMLAGALAQSLPDIDFIASSWMDTSQDVWVHRGITHSLFFVLCVAPLLALAARRAFRGGREAGVRKVAIDGRGDAKVGQVSFKEWCLFFGFQLLIHIVLDAFNAYGTGWFEPFSHYRVSFHVLFVADPFYSLWLGIAFLGLVLLKKNAPARKYWVRSGLILSSLYLGYCVTNKFMVDAQVRKELLRQQIAYTRYFTTPTPLNSWLWYIVAEDEHGFHTGYLSVFDKRPEIEFNFFPRNDSLLDPFRRQEDVRNLLRFSQGYYTVDRWKDRLVFNDLRFGQMKGWEDGRAGFVFHYFLEQPGDNMVIVQRGRFAGWDWETVRAFVRRIGGN
jgi:inner membrane protein